MQKYLLAVLITFISIQMKAQDRTITGKVVDSEDNSPLIGCTVVLDGTQKGTITDLEGKYVILVPKSGGTLTFTYIGYKTQKATIKATNILNISLNPTEEMLEELVVVGYGTEIKTKLTGSISEIDGEDIALTPVSTVEQTLQGKAAGVFIEANNGKVGGDVKIRIRGSSSINANNQPLFIVDGIPINTAS